MARTASPLTAIRRMRTELDKLEKQLTAVKTVGRHAKVASRPARRGSPRQACSQCGEVGHNKRFHRRPRVATQRRRR